MKRVIFFLGTLLLSAGLALPVAAEERPGFVTFCYHEVILEPSDQIAADTMPVLLTVLTDHFDWLREHGYNVVGVDDILRAKNGGKPLPPQSVLISFDDGYASFYHLVFPLLKAYNYKAMLALETAWLETPADRPVDYGGEATMPRSHFLSWAQVKEMADSGLVEIASHSHDLHRGHQSMPQDSPQPSGATRAYNPQTKTYESWKAYKQRIKNDVSRSADIIERHIGRRPRVLVWPYGRYTQPGVKAALEAGYQLTASLGFEADWPTIPRFLAYNNLNFGQTMALIESGMVPGHSLQTKIDFDNQYAGPYEPRYPLQRVMHVDIDMLYDPDPVQQHENISALLDRVEAMGINVVYLQAYADPDGNGTADALYFPSRHLPLRADLFNYISWRLFSRLGVEVYAWMPVLGFEIPGRPLVEAVSPDKIGSVYDRLTPFDRENKKIIQEIYQDLASLASFQGVIIHDDAVLGDYEDVSPAGRGWLRAQGLPEDPLAVRADPGLMNRFSRAKSLALIDFTLDLMKAVRTWQSPVKTARNMYAPVVMNPDSEAWFAQNMNDFLANYDYVGLMSMPFMEQAANPQKWLKELAAKVKAYPLGARKTVFELQAVDWRGSTPVPSRVLARQMDLLEKSGIGNFGYYPDNPIEQHPDVETLYPYFSLQDNPLLKKDVK